LLLGSAVTTPEPSLFPVWDNGGWGYVDGRGLLRIPTTYRWASDFYDGRALVETATGKGFINAEGEYAVPPIYREATDFREGLAAVRDRTGWHLLDVTGRIVAHVPGTAEVRRPAGGLVRLVGDYTTYMTTAGVRVPGTFDDGFDFSEDTAATARLIRGQLKWGYIDALGREKIPFRYDFATPFQGGRATVTEGEKWGVIDRQGKYIVEPKYSFARRFSEGRADVCSGDVCGFLDRNGEVVVKLQYIATTPFHEGRAWTRTASGWGAIDLNGNVVIKHEYTDVRPFTNGRALVLKDDELRYVDHSGAILWRGKIGNAFDLRRVVV
jgi:hypothetical protein